MFTASVMSQERTIDHLAAFDIIELEKKIQKACYFSYLPVIVRNCPVGELVTIDPMMEATIGLKLVPNWQTFENNEQKHFNR